MEFNEHNASKTYEQLNDAVHSANLTLPKTKSEAELSICSTWVAARPLLEVVAGLSFLPTKWTSVLHTLIVTMNFICPTKVKP